MRNGTALSRGLVEDALEAPPGPEEATPTYATGEAARMLGVTSSRVRKMIASGELAAHRDEHGHHRIAQEALGAKLRERGVASPTGTASEGPEEARGQDEPREDRPRQEFESLRRELRGLAQEVRALRGELVPLARLAHSAQEGKESALEELGVLREERARLLASLEEERRRAGELEDEYEAFRLKWWERATGPRYREERGT